MDTLLGLVIIGAVTYWWMRRRKAKNESQGSLKITVQGSDSGDELKSGRAKLPGKRWVCTRCGREFSISVDPKTVPRMWWIPSNNEKGNSPWACPDCGTYAYTVPRD